MVKRWLTTAAVLLAVFAVVELVLLGVVVWQIGVAFTLALLIVKSVVGWLLVRRTGRRGWRQFRTAVDSGRPPGREGTDAAVGLGAAMLVLLGGFLGALGGLLMLVPPVRRRTSGLAERVVERQLTAVAANGVFGPRRVKVRRDGRPPAPDTAAAPTPTTAPPDGGPPPALEGEVLPPR